MTNPQTQPKTAAPEPIPVTQLLKPSDGRNLESECSVIGTVLHFPEAYLQVAYLLKPEDFAASLSAILWRAIGTLTGSGHTISLHTLAAEAYKRADLIERLKVIDEADLADLIAREYMSAEVNAKNIPLYANAVLDKAVRRRINSDLMAGAMKLAGEKRTLDREYVREQLSELLFRTVGESTVRGRRDAADISDTVFEQITNGGLPAPLPTGFDSFNRTFNGDYAGQLSVLFGHQGQGKTSLLTSSIYYDMRNGIPVALFTMEQNAAEVMLKLYFKLTGLRHKLVRGIPLNPQDKLQLANAREQIARWPLKICSDYPRIQVGQMRTVLQEYAMLQGFQPLKVYHDGIWLTDISEDQRRRYPTANRTAEIGLITKDLIGLGEDFGAAIWSTHQLNRVQHKTENEKVDKNDLSDSSELLNNAHRVFAIHRPENHDPHTQWYCLKDRPTGGAGWEVTLDYAPDVDLYHDVGATYESPF